MHMQFLISFQCQFSCQEFALVRASLYSLSKRIFCFVDNMQTLACSECSVLRVRVQVNSEEVDDRGSRGAEGGAQI